MLDQAAEFFASSQARNNSSPWPKLMRISILYHWRSWRIKLRWTPLSEVVEATRPSVLTSHTASGSAMTSNPMSICCKRCKWFQRSYLGLPRGHRHIQRATSRPSLSCKYRSAGHVWWWRRIEIANWWGYHSESRILCTKNKLPAHPPSFARNINDYTKVRF